MSNKNEQHTENYIRVPLNFVIGAIPAIEAMKEIQRAGTNPEYDNLKTDELLDIIKELIKKG